MKKDDSVAKEIQKRTNIMINDARRRKLIEIGNGNLSEGIRIACDAFKIKK